MTRTSKWHQQGELEFCDLIADMGRCEGKALSWWASSLAEKNFVLSRLWDNLNAFLRGERYSYPRRSWRDLPGQFLRQCYRMNLMAPLALRRRPLPERVDVIFMTHFDRRSLSTPYRDHFWHPLVEHLQSQGRSFVFVGLTSNDEHLVRDFLLNPVAAHPPVLPLERFMSPFDALRSLWQTWRYRLRLPDPILFHGQDIRPVLLGEFSEDRLGGHLFINLCRYFALARMLRQFNPHVVYWPWENHCWEKLLVKARDHVSPQTWAIGHLHAAIPLSFLNFLPGRGEPEAAPFPDRVLVLGEFLYEFLSHYADFPVGCLELGCALRYGHLQSLPLRTAAPGRTVGVVFPWSPVISAWMLRQLEAFLQTTPEVYRLLLKFHPGLPHCRIPGAPPLSKAEEFQGGIELFLEKVDILIYAETTVVFEALARGIPVIYLDSGKGPLGDALPAETGLNWKATSSESLAVALDEIQRLPLSALNRRRQAAHPIVRQYFQPIEPAMLARFWPDGARTLLLEKP